MNENNQIIIYQTEDGQTQVDVRMENDTCINNVFKEGELNKEEVCAKIAHTA